MEHLKTAVEELFKMDRQLMGPGYESGLEYLNHLIGLDIIETPSGTKAGSWTVPDEWIAKQAYLSKDKMTLLDHALNPLSLVVYSNPFKGKVSKEELLKHLHYSDVLPEATPYVFKFYDRDWGFCAPKVFRDNLEDGDYEVFIDTEFRPGKMKIGVHTIKGKSDREILLFAHLDHAWQANDNLSGIACLLDVVTKIKAEHTIKIIFCPETIGSQAYAYTQDISKVDFVIAVDICGNDQPLLLQKSWNQEDRINRVAHCALQVQGRSYRKGLFRTCIGSDETVFNDPLIGIPGILLTTWAPEWKEYHTSEDTPEKLDYSKIQEFADYIVKVISIYERDYIPERQFKGPLMRSRFGLQSPSKALNLNWDYFIYSMDGERSLAELCAEFELNFDYVHSVFDKIIKDGFIKCRSLDSGKGPVKKAAGKKR